MGANLQRAASDPVIENCEFADKLAIGNTSPLVKTFSDNETPLADSNNIRSQHMSGNS